MNAYTLSLASIFFYSTAFASHLYSEKQYQDAWCKKAGGVTEFTLEDRARVDCLTEEYAIEFDFAPKWAEAIGQALYYALATGRRPGVVLIQEEKGDSRFLDRLKRVAERYHISVWTMTPAELF